MDRKILFRGKSKNGNKWVYGDLISPKNNENCYSIFEIGGGCVKVKANTIGQYVGFKDKNGKKIFTDDIVKDEWGRIMQVVYKQEWGKFNFKLLKITGQKWTNNFIWADLTDWFNESTEILPEIIGNAWDNKSLLRGENG